MNVWKPIGGALLVSLTMGAIGHVVGEPFTVFQFSTVFLLAHLVLAKEPTP